MKTKTKLQRTAGPWKIEPYQVARGGSPIVGNDGTDDQSPTLIGWMNEMPDHPDARLIVAAPLLLKIVRDHVSYCEITHCLTCKSGAALIKDLK